MEAIKKIYNICKEENKFPWNRYETLVDDLSNISILKSNQRKFLMQCLGSQIVQILDTEFFEEKDVPFLFELKNVVSVVWNEGYEAQYVIKNIDKKIKSILKEYDNFEYIDMFFSKLEYPYTKESLKKCKVKIIKENHPDNGGDGQHIQIIQEIYKNFLDYLK